MHQTMREIMERAIGDMREALAQEVDDGESGHWDPDAWEEVKAEQAKAQAPFVPDAGEVDTCTGGTPVVVEPLGTD